MSDERRLATISGRVARFGRWHVEPLGAGHEGDVRVRLSCDDRDAEVELALHVVGSKKRALARTAIGDLTYVHLRGIGEEEAARLTQAFAKNVERAPGSIAARFPHLAPMLALPEEREREVLFDPPGLAELLAPEIEIDGAPFCGHVLRSIQLPMTGDEDRPERYLLAFEAEDGARAFVEVGTGVERAFGLAGPLAIGVRQFGRAAGFDDLVPLSIASLSSHLLALLAGKLRTCTLRFVGSIHELRALGVPDGKLATKVRGANEVLEPPILNLAIDAECGQQCVFCSVKELQQPSDGGDRELARLTRELAMARSKGVREVRLNGIDPLAFSRVLEVTGEIARLGFERMTVYSTARRFADARFTERFVERAPRALSVIVPIYGTRADIHDAVTGTEGAWSEAMAALSNLGRALRPPASLGISTVAVRANVDDLVAIVRFAVERGLRLEAHLPYPMQQRMDDPYVDATLEERELIERVLETCEGVPPSIASAVHALLASLVPHPCLLLAAETAHETPLFSLRDERAPTHLHGTEYRSDRFVHVASQTDEAERAFSVPTVPCPHVDRCALAPACAREHYALYRQRFGEGELRPVSPLELYRIRTGR